MFNFMVLIMVVFIQATFSIMCLIVFWCIRMNAKRDTQKNSKTKNKSEICQTIFWGKVLKVTYYALKLVAYVVKFIL